MYSWDKNVIRRAGTGAGRTPYGWQPRTLPLRLPLQQQRWSCVVIVVVLIILMSFVSHSFASSSTLDNNNNNNNNNNNINNETGDIFSLRSAADKAVGTGQYTEALRLYTRALDMAHQESSINNNTDNNQEEVERVLFKRAELYRLRRNWSAAEKDLSRLLKHRPTHTAAALMLGRIHLRRGDPRAAVEVIHSFTEQKEKQKEKQKHRSSKSMDQILNHAQRLIDIIDQYQSPSNNNNNNNQQQQQHDNKHNDNNNKQRPSFEEACISSIEEAARDAKVDMSLADGELRRVRAECACRSSSSSSAADAMQHRSLCISDTKYLMQRRPRDPAVITLYAAGLFRLGRTDDALGALRRCMRFDPDSRRCRTMLKTMKHAEKDREQGMTAGRDGRHEDAASMLQRYINSVVMGIQNNNSNNNNSNNNQEGLLTSWESARDVHGFREAVHQLCSSLVELSGDNINNNNNNNNNNININDDAIGKCGDAIEMEESNSVGRLDALLLRAEAYLNRRQYRQYQQHHSEDNNNNNNNNNNSIFDGDDANDTQEQQQDVEDAKQDVGRAEHMLRQGCEGCGMKEQDRIRRMQGLIEQALRKDYYRILGLSRRCTTREVKRAYRRLARKVHPDVARNVEAKKAEAKFHEIAEAYEVLSDPELRQRYDNGEDVMSNNNGGGGGGGGHHHGFQRGPGSNVKFTFRRGGGGGHPFDNFFRF